MKPVSRTPRFALLTAALLIVGCSKEPEHTSASATAKTPLVQPDAADAKPTEQFQGSFAPSGLQANYRASFGANDTITIEETRSSFTPTTPRAVYEFRGARLLKYQGSALHSTDNVELQFDLQGKVLVARSGDKEASADEITAIRDRAQSLRSHAVARHAVVGHER